MCVDIKTWRVTVEVYFQAGSQCASNWIGWFDDGCYDGGSDVFSLVSV